MCRVPGRVCGTLSTFTTPQDGDARPHCRDKADNSRVGARDSPAHRDTGFTTTGFATTGFATTGFATTGFTTTGFTTTGFAATGFAATGFAATGFAATGFATTGHLPDRMPTGDITAQATPHSANQPQHRRPACQTTAPSDAPLSIAPFLHHWSAPVVQKGCYRRRVGVTGTVWLGR